MTIPLKSLLRSLPVLVVFYPYGTVAPRYPERPDTVAAKVQAPTSVKTAKDKDAKLRKGRKASRPKRKANAIIKPKHNK